MKTRKDTLPTKPCEWCRRPFRAERRHGIEQRFCARACFVEAKRHWGVIKRVA